MLDNLIHHISDFFTLIWWLLDTLKALFSTLVQPLTWAFNFGKGFFSTAFKTPEQLGLEVGQIGSFSQSVFDFFDIIPYFNYILMGIAGVLWILFLAFIVKKLSAI